MFVSKSATFIEILLFHLKIFFFENQGEIYFLKKYFLKIIFFLEEVKKNFTFFKMLQELPEEELRDELVYCRNNHVMFMASAKTMNPMKKDFYLITGTMHYLQQFESGNVVYFMDDFGVNYFLFSYR